MGCRFKILLTISLVGCLSLSMFGCGSGENIEPGIQKDGNSEEQKERSAPAETKEVKYFEQCKELPRPDSIIDAEEEAARDFTEYGTNVTPYTIITFRLNNDGEGGAKARLETYISKLTEHNLKLTADAANLWTIVSGDTNIARLEFMSESNMLTVLTFPESERQKNVDLTFGQTVETENYTFTLTNVEWLKEITPPSTDYVYSYRPEVPGKTYCIVTGTFKNLGGTGFSFRETPVWFSNMNGKYQYDGTAEYLGDGGVNSIGNTNDLEPLNEVPIYLYASVPDELVQNFSGGTITWSFPRDTRYHLNF